MHRKRMRQDAALERKREAEDERDAHSNKSGLHTALVVMIEF
jgi:hypothetical protein